MKVGFIGCVKFSAHALKTVLGLRSKGISVVAVVTKSASSFNADYEDLTPLCAEHGIPVHFADLGTELGTDSGTERDTEHDSDGVGTICGSSGSQLVSQPGSEPAQDTGSNSGADSTTAPLSASQREQNCLAFMQRHKPDVVYCFGWSHLLGEGMLNVAPLGTMGYHPAMLPQNRGRHPIIWALALGLKETGSTFFKMDAGADSGPILSQRVVSISQRDDAADLYARLMEVAQEQIAEFTLDLADGSAVFSEQDHAAATYWRKRSRSDGMIDWRMRAEDIYNLVRALAPPYPGAEFTHKGNAYQVFASRLSDRTFSENIEPGRVLEIAQGMLLVKCAGNSAIWLEKHSLGMSEGMGVSSDVASDSLLCTPPIPGDYL